MLPRMEKPQVVRALQARPLAVVATLFALVMVGNALLVGCGGKKEEEETDTPPTTSATSTPAPAGDLGSQVYATRCVTCHGPAGKGDGPAAAGLNPKPRNHTDGSYMNSRTDAQLLEVIRNGKGAMPAWGKILSDQEIQAVLKHVRTLAVPPYSGS